MKKSLSILFSTLVIALIPLMSARSALAEATVPFTCSGAFLYDNTPIVDPDVLQPSILSTLNFTAAPALSKTTFGTASGAVNAMGYRTQDNFLYAIGTEEPGENSNHNHLFQFDKDGGETDLGEVTGLDADKKLVSGAFGSDGFLYAFTGDNDTTMYKINVTDQTSTTITLDAHKSINDIAFNILDGKFYGYDSGDTGATDDGKVVSITTTGAITLVGTKTDYLFNDMGAIWVFGGKMYGLENRTGLLREFALSGADAGNVVGTTFTLSPPDGEPGSTAQHDGASCATASFAPPTPTPAPTPALPDSSVSGKSDNKGLPWSAVLLSTFIVGFGSLVSYVIYKKKYLSIKSK